MICALPSVHRARLFVRRMSLSLAPLPRSLRCGDSGENQGALLRRSRSPGMPVHDPKLPKVVPRSRLIPRSIFMEFLCAGDEIPIAFLCTLA